MSQKHTNNKKQQNRRKTHGFRRFGGSNCTKTSGCFNDFQFSIFLQWFQCFGVDFGIDFNDFVVLVSILVFVSMISVFWHGFWHNFGAFFNQTFNFFREWRKCVISEEYNTKRASEPSKTFDFRIDFSSNVHVFFRTLFQTPFFEGQSARLCSKARFLTDLALPLGSKTGP